MNTAQSSALDAVRSAKQKIIHDDSMPLADRLTALSLLFNVTDHLLGLIASPYLSRVFAEFHTERAREWRERLHIRTCDNCGTRMHDMHAICVTDPDENAWVFCESCLVLSGFGTICPQCALVYAHEDIGEYVNTRPTNDVRGMHTAPFDTAYACVDCIVTIRRTA